MRSSVRLRRALVSMEFALDDVVALGVGVEHVSANAHLITGPAWRWAALRRSAHLRDAFAQRFADGGFLRLGPTGRRAKVAAASRVGMSFIAIGVKSWLAAACALCDGAASVAVGVRGRQWVPMAWRTIQF